MLYYMAIELGNVAESLETVLDTEDWAVFRVVSIATLAAWLYAQAVQVNLCRYRKTARGPKKPPPKRSHDPKRSHVSVARVLAQRKKTAP